ncbi:MAG: hypothetical protein ACFFAJ_10515 [Candidatus Hodarchaeota archaeon]
MGKRVLLGCLFVLMLTPISFIVAEPMGVKKANEISITIFEMKWSKTFGGVEEDSARSLIQTADGGYALAGYTGSWP